MKKHIFFSLFLSICLLTSLFTGILVSGASAEAERKPIEKISVTLLSHMDATDAAASIPVVLWFADEDFDKDAIEAQAIQFVALVNNNRATLRTGNFSVPVSSMICSGDDVTTLSDSQLLIESKRKIYENLYRKTNAEKISFV